MRYKSYRLTLSLQPKVRRFLFSIVLRYHHGNDTTKSEKAKYKEEPEEPLGVASQINAIVFLITFVDLPAFVGKHSMNFLQVALHLDQYLFVVLVKHLLHLLQVSIIDIYRHL